MNYTIYLYKSLFSRILYALLFLTLSRLIFLLFNQHLFVHFSGIEIFQAFLAGLIFDSGFISYGLSLFILFKIFPSKFHDTHFARNCAKIYFLLVIGFGLLLNFVDTAYFSFSQKRTGIELFYLIKDPANSLSTYFIDYWYLLVLLVLFIYGMYKFYPFSKTTFAYQFKPKNSLLAILVLCLLFLGMRGSFGLKPLKSSDASIFVKSGLESMALNTPFQIMSSIDSKQSEVPFTIQTFSEDFDSVSMRNYSNTPVLEGAKNIVLIVLESFGRDYVGFLTEKETRTNSFTPFIDSLSQYSLVFPNCYANGTKSIEALPALFSSFPAILEQPLIYSWYQANTLRGQHYYLDKSGYDCSFYHGAINGTMGFESFLKKTGPIDYYGLLEYALSKTSHHDGHWGILDHHYLNYYSKQLSQKKTPYFSSIFTLSSHHPYNVPKEFSLLLPKGNIELLQSIAYTDFSLRMFFDQRKNDPDHKNTVYILIGDHCSHSDNNYFYTSKGKMELYCMVYDPSGEIAPGINNKTVQQLDIMPTVLHLSNYRDSFFSIGNSFFDTSSQGKALFWVDGAFHLVKNEHIYSENSNGESSFAFQPKEQFRLPIPFQENLLLKDEMELEMKQLIALIHRRLKKNQFY